MKKLNLYFIPILIFSLIVFISYIVFLQKGKSVISTSSNSQIAISSPTPSIQDIINWRVYENNKFGFELKHPENFIDFETWGSGYTDRLPITISLHKKLSENSFDGEGLFITITDRSEYGLDNSVKTLDSYINNVRTVEKKVKINQTSIDGQRAFKVVFGNGKDMELLYTEPDTYRGLIEYVIQKDNIFYIFEYRTNKVELIPIFDHILSTFRFVR